MALGTMYSEILCILRDNRVDQSVILQLISWTKVITRGQQRNYNRQLKGATHKRITNVLWKDYNHSVLALALWNGFVDSLSADFESITVEADDPLQLLTAPELMPIRGMREALIKHGLPLEMSKRTSYGFSVKPDTSWARMRKKLDRSDLK